MPWKFRKKGEKEWKKAQVPGSVYTDLQNNQLIPDPYTGENEKHVQWVETTGWEYKSAFTVSEQQLNTFSYAELIFEGLDTYATVYLNDSLILVCDNMFRTWTKEVRRLLQNGTNTLRIVFEPAVNKAKAEATKLSYTLPEGERVFARKAQFQFGWDFAPRLAGCGIIKSVKINFRNGLQLHDVHIEQMHTDSALSILKATVDIESDINQAVNIRLQSDNQAQKIQLDKSVALKKGMNTIPLGFSIKHPALWWCRGLGIPSLYNFKLTVSNSRDECIIAEKQIGLRTIELVQEKDNIGTSFYFKLNSRAVFIKGANCIPPDAIINRTPDTILPEIAAELNMNMLRVWGGGAYASDAFYRACDEKGILVWQDFMFACAMYPGDETFLANIRQEITEQVKRLRDHACLALWCGNNESDEGWNNWGWQKQHRITAKDSVSIWNDYKKLFHELIPGILKTYNPETAYRPSSPQTGWGHAESLTQGDSHYWGVWWGKEPLENYNSNVGRFMSEYGFQGMPSFSSFKKYCTEQELNLNSPSVTHHQKNTRGYQTIQTYMNRDFKTPEKFEEYSYVSQVLQAHGMSMAIEAHRRSKPYCMGTLFWQLNDCWPVTSWSAVDYYGEPKAFYYYAKRLYQTVILSVKERHDSLHLFVISDSLQALNGTLNIFLKNFNGEILWEKTAPLAVKENSVGLYAFSKKELPSFDTTASYLHAQYTMNNFTSEKNHFFARPKYLQLPKAALSIRRISSSQYEISSDVFAKDAGLYSDKGGLLFSDNFFDLEPGVKKTVSVVKSYMQGDNSEPHAIILNNLINLHEK